MTHTLTTSMTLPVPRSEVFQFFAEAQNLERITPPELRFKILTPLPIEIKQDSLIEYSLILHGARFRWLSKITRWNPPHEFVDEQLSGPYKMWIHSHTFEEQNGVTTINDEVCYRLPFWPLGEFAYPVVRRQLNKIFRFRQEVVHQFFASKHER